MLHDEANWLYIFDFLYSTTKLQVLWDFYLGLKISVGHGYCPPRSWNCPTYVERKPLDILSDLSETEVHWNGIRPNCNVNQNVPLV
jgi:hypothetical protein